MKDRRAILPEVWNAWRELSAADLKALIDQIDVMIESLQGVRASYEGVELQEADKKYIAKLDKQIMALWGKRTTAEGILVALIERPGEEVMRS